MATRAYDDDDGYDEIDDAEYHELIFDLYHDLYDDPWPEWIVVNTRGRHRIRRIEDVDTKGLT